jgi:hypothetical protein
MRTSGLLNVLDSVFMGFRKYGAVEALDARGADRDRRHGIFVVPADGYLDLLGN